MTEHRPPDAAPGDEAAVDPAGDDRRSHRSPFDDPVVAAQAAAILRRGYERYLAKQQAEDQAGSDTPPDRVA